MNDDVCLAMEYNWTLTFRVKVGGAETVVIGECHYVDEKARCYVVDTDDGWARLRFDEVITVTSGLSRRPVALTTLPLGLTQKGYAYYTYP